MALKFNISRSKPILKVSDYYIKEETREINFERAKNFTDLVFPPPRLFISFSLNSSDHDSKSNGIPTLSIEFHRLTYSALDFLKPSASFSIEKVFIRVKKNKMERISLVWDESREILRFETRKYFYRKIHAAAALSCFHNLLVVEEKSSHTRKKSL